MLFTPKGHEKVPSMQSVHIARTRCQLVMLNFAKPLSQYLEALGQCLSNI